MAAIIGLGLDKIQTICKTINNSGEICALANFNSEAQIVISGTKNGVAQAMEKAKEAGAAKVVPLTVSGAFHSSLMARAVEKMSPLIGKVSFSPAQHPVITNVDAHPTQDPQAFKTKLIQQIDHSVLWDTTIKTIISVGIQTFIEVGPGTVLGTLVKRLDRSKSIFFTDDPSSIDKIFSSQAPPTT
jgi:[acyl-carrier-protein] S-malonyltransferase